MRFGFRFSCKRGALIALAALVAGCTGAQHAPGAVPFALPFDYAQGRLAQGDTDTGADRAIAAWMKPGAASGDLLYASGFSEQYDQSEVFILSYPQGQLVGSIAIATQGMCSDTQGNVYLLNQNAAIEYAHGGTRAIRTVHIPGADTVACAVDPTTGNLAVTFYCPPCGSEDLAIFPPGSGQSTRYDAPLANTVGYDNQGNLFLASYDSGSAIAELPNGTSQFIDINLNEDIGQSGQIQWDGKYITLQNIKTPSTISRISISGTSGTVVSQEKFGLYMRRVGYSWLSGDGTVTFPLATRGGETNEIGIWKYPKAPHIMKIIKKIASGDRGFGSVTVSLAASRSRTRRLEP
jgi:hypothetical protein